MKSLDELRKYARGYETLVNHRLLEIADRIEAEHEKAIEEAVEASKDDAVEFAKRIEGAVKSSKDVTLFGVDYTKLAKDAEGEYVHVGDVMERTNGETFEVIGIGGDDTLFYVNHDDSMVADWTKASNKRHHKPTAKDVLRDVVTLCYNAWKEGSAFEFYDVDDVMNSGNIAYFAAKLQLRED